MTRLTKIISLSFPSGSSSTGAKINIPFDVKYINFKCTLYQSTTPVDEFIILKSNLTQFEPIGICIDNKAKPMNTFINSTYEFEKPANINGNYDFFIVGIADTPFISAGDACAIIAEFVSI